MSVINPRDILQHAKRQEWSARRLVRDAFPTMSMDTATKLLAGSAIITEVKPDGKFTVYVPGVSTFDKTGREV